MEVLSDALRWELAPFGIEVVLVEPGSIKTHFADAAQARAQEILSNPTSPYQTLYQQNERVTAGIRQNEPWPDVVSKVVQQGMEASKPKARCQAGVPFAAKLVLPMGDSVLNMAVRQMYKITPAGTD